VTTVRRPAAAEVSAANVRGSVMMVVAVGLLAIMDAGLKLLAAHYPPLQVAALRGLASWPLVAVWVLATVPVRSLFRVRWPLHLVRGAIAIAMLASFAFALQTLPLTTAYALFFVAPLLITALSVPLLGERVGPRRWAAIALGLVGVLVVLRPSGEGMFSLAGLAVLVAALGYALSAITVRVLGRTDSTQAMVFWLVGFLALGAGLLAAPRWVAIDSGHWLLIAGVGATGALGQWAVTEAFRQGEASVVAPLEYSALAWGLALDLALWGVLPDGVTWIGAGIIVASGLYLLRRERMHVEAQRP
jgi:drug/metabolite transporter (DMT)-like permease